MRVEAFFFVFCIVVITSRMHLTINNTWYNIMKTLIFFAISILLSFPSITQILPVDKNATTETIALYANLKAISATGVIFGHQDDLAYGIGWKAEAGRSDVKEVCGSYPGLYGWDVSKLGKPLNIDSVSFDNMKKWIVEAYERGGINTISWHMDNPVTGGDSWDNTPAVSALLPGGEKHDYFIDRLDLFANFLNDIETADGAKVPIIFRPFHEHTGSWFWWGKGNCTANEYISLWQLTVKYLRDKTDIHHLLFSYSTDQFNSQEQYLEFYPGDEFVDIIAFDDYHSIANEKEGEKLIYRLRTVVELAEEKGKVAAFSETGLEKVPINNWFTEILLKGIKADTKGKNIAFVMVWRNGRPDHFYAPFPGHSSAVDFVKFRKDPFTIFEDDLPDMYTMPD